MKDVKEGMKLEVGVWKLKAETGEDHFYGAVV